ncbi:glyoxalase [Microbacterium sp. CFH 90308]|uniref:Glyoxalase n=1 Tax=Microbacterium salsuginis TaxID=2722803 RepID=A0ABX1KGW5_9MICO|nr:VOC family protein [Microbacterium sp. CFH 90308]NLP85350.1 glyoxalase [Microbacterium sp. CFH 90308]
MSRFGSLHHVELQTADLAAAIPQWDWLLGELGYVRFQDWDGGRSWRNGDAYIVVARAPRPGSHDRRAPGLSHLAFHAGSEADVDRVWQACVEQGWKQLYTDTHPWAGGDEHYAAFLENGDRFKVELVASDPAR